VPVIVLLTKADTLRLPAVQQLQKRGCTWEEAIDKAVEEERDILHRLMESIEHSLETCKFPPQSYLPLSGKYSFS
jgi:hypothetical protein